MSESGDYKELRRDYVAPGLGLSDLATDPYEQFSHWMESAKKRHPDDATSMSLATATADGCPSVRIVLLKHFDEEGFCWYTDYRSHKGQELADNPQAELLFYWRGLERQVRIWGAVEKLGREDAVSYFNQRPLGSRLSAAASCQSSVIDGRFELEQQVEDLILQYPEGDIPCPQEWGGYRLKAERFEFWQGRENRLHDRFCYSQQLTGWQIVRLAP